MSVSRGARRRRKPGPGRTALNRELRKYGVRLRPNSDVELQRQADSVGIHLGTYMRLVLADAHGIPWSRHDPDSRLPLPLAVSSDELRAATAALEARDIVPAEGLATSVRLDPDLGDVIEERSDEFAVAFTRYLGTVLDIAAGNHPGVPGHQPSLLDDHEGDGPFADRSRGHQGARLAS